MKHIVPDFYPDFRCTASACRHCCCIGWEIDIDQESLDRYLTIGGDLGRKLHSSISRQPPHFILEEDERCPFLNKDGLCELILSCGEDILCEICTEHPRFHNYFSDRIESGLGLCCEEAARLLLTHVSPISFIDISSPADICRCSDSSSSVENTLFKFRDELIALSQNRELSIQQRISGICRRCHISLSVRSVPEWARFYMTLERLDTAWSEILENIINGWEQISAEQFSRYMSKRMYVYENLLVYFLYRHLLSNAGYDIPQRAGFAALSTAMLYAADAVYFQIHGQLPIEQQIEHVRMYSSEIEYSDENVNEIIDSLRG